VAACSVFVLATQKMVKQNWSDYPKKIKNMVGLFPFLAKMKALWKLCS
jgi:hypothetical protein